MSSSRHICARCGQAYRWDHVGSKDYGARHIGCPALQAKGVSERSGPDEAFRQIAVASLAAAEREDGVG